MKMLRKDLNLTRLAICGLACLVFVFVFVSAGSAQGLSGTALDEKQTPLPDVKVSIPALHRVTFTDKDGRFSFERLPVGVYSVAFSFIGYKTENRTVNLATGDAVLSVVLQQSPLELPPTTVTAKPQPTDILNSPQPVAVIMGRELEQKRGQTVMETIENAPGVATFSTGPGIVKPVIRGLTSQRVLIVVDGIRQEGQQWGDEHSPEIDALDVERIEIVRGPNSVLYGSDALGGVVNVIKPELPVVDEGDPVLGGSLLLNGFSNNRQGAGAVSAFGAKGKVGYRANFGYRKSRDVSTPERKLFNSGTEDLVGGGTLGIKGEWGTLSADFSHITQEEKIHEDPAEDPIATPFLKNLHDKLHLHGNFPFRKVRLELNSGWQRNDRKEFEAKDEPDPALHLRLNTITTDVKAHHLPVGPAFGTVGFSLMTQDNQTLGEEHLIPEFKLINVAGYLYEELRFSQVSLSGGFRFDSRSMDVEENTDLGVPAQTRDYNSVSGTVGAVWRAAEPVAFAISVGRGWRAPTVFELFSNGVHEGTVRFEIGDSMLKTEASLNLDMSLRYASHRFQGEITVFHNSIDRYIFLSPTGQTDSSSGFEIFETRQADATLVGAEVDLKAQVLDWLVASGGVDMTRGTNDQTDRPLPLIPPYRLKLGLRVTRPNLGGFSNPYFSIGAKVVDDQERLEVFENPTVGYALFDAGMGAEIPVGAQKARVDLAVQNLLDRAYREHLSRYKEYALNPGRNFTAKLTVPFDLAR